MHSHGDSSEDLIADVQGHFGPPLATAQPIIHVPEMEAASVDQKTEQPMIEHDASHLEVFHGAFSKCVCKGCMEAAKKEVQKRYTDETLTLNYIMKLEGLVDKLQCTAERNDRDDLSEQADCLISPRIDPPRMPSYRMAPPRMALPPPPPPPPPPAPPGFFFEMGVEDPTDTSPNEGDGPKVAIVRKKKFISQHGDEQIHADRGTGTGESSAKDVRYQSVLTVYRHFDKRNTFWQRSIKIMSQPFIKVLRETSDYDVDIVLNDQSLLITEPLMLLFHNRRQLTRYLQDNNTKYKDNLTKQSMDHTKLILDYMRNEFEDVTQKLDDLESTQPSKLIDFPDIWLLYPPGTVVYSTEHGEHEAYIVDSVHGVSKYPRGRSGKQFHSRLELTCWSINYDGEIFGRQWTTHVISPFNGTKEISTLDLVPEAFLPDAETVKENLIARGKSFWGLQGQNYREYTGEIWSQQMSEDPIRVMIDHLTYQRRTDWPIVINKKKGPSGALSKNWRDNRFSPNQGNHNLRAFDERRGRRPARIAPPPPMLPPRGYSPDREYEDDQTQESYMVYETHRPPYRGDSKFNKYDSLEPDSKPNDLTLLLCPQHVHGYCLKDKTWSR